MLAAHGSGERRASEPPVVLRLRGRSFRATDRACWGALGVAMAASAALILWLNRGTTFAFDQYDYVEEAPGLGVTGLLDPQNGHLVLITRLAYSAILETLGIGYLPFRLLGVLAVLAAAATFYALVKPRMGALAALAPTVVLLFFGSTYHVPNPVGFSNLLSIAFGLGALLALERRDRVGDVLGCALGTLSVVTFGTGTAFVAGMAVSVLLPPDRWRRAWVFAVPVVLYAAWWVYATPSDHPHAPETQVSNALLIPSYIAESLAGALAALAGLNFDFTDPVHARDVAWGYPLAVLAVVALALRIWRGNLPHALWVSIAILLAYWSILALSVDPFIRPVGALRYLYMGAVGVLLVATAAAAPLRLSGRGLAVLFAVAAFSLATNLAHLRERAGHFREDYSVRAKAQFTALDLARDHVDPGFDPTGPLSSDIAPVSTPVGTYREIVDRYGSPGYTLAELERQREDVRQVADQVLASALGIELEPAPPDEASGACRTARPEAPGAAIDFELPLDGAILRAQGATPAPVTLGRFADSASVEVGDLVPDETTALRIPADPSPRPWRATAPGDVRLIRVCALR